MPHHGFLPRPPRPDPIGGPPKRRSHLAMLALVAMLPRRRKGRDPDGGSVPVEPNRPNSLSGAAAAPLEFDGE
jgi:hypothetical protein